MTKGFGVGAAILGESTGELVKPGMTRADLERIETHGPSRDVPDPFGDFFRSTESGRSATIQQGAVRPSVVQPSATVVASGATEPSRRTDAELTAGSSSSSHAPGAPTSARSCDARVDDAAEQRKAPAPLSGRRPIVVPLVVSLSLRGAAAVEKLLRDEISSAGRLPPTVLGAALRHCADRGLLRCVQLLVKQGGAPLDERGGSSATCAAQAEPAGRTALQLAAARGHVEVCRFLLACGANTGGACEAVDRHLAPYEKFFVTELAQLRQLLGGARTPLTAQAASDTPGRL